MSRGWGGDSVIKSTCLSCSGLGLGSQLAQDGSHQYLALVDTPASSGLHRYKARMWHLYIQANKTLKHCFKLNKNLGC